MIAGLSGFGAALERLERRVCDKPEPPWTERMVPAGNICKDALVLLHLICR